jgi:hypothetical protein
MFINRKRSATKAVVAIAIATVVGGPVAALAQDNAQDETDERIRACGEIEDATERMDCFNTVVEGLNEGSDVAAASPTDVDAAPAASAAEIAAVSGAAATTSAPSTAAGASAAASATSTASPAAEVEDFGLEEQKAAEGKQEEKEQEAESGSVSIHSIVVTSEKSGLNHFVVGLDNGQVWEETDGSRRMGLPRTGTPVEVYKGKLGGYRMKVGGDNRVAWVRRLK